MTRQLLYLVPTSLNSVVNPNELAFAMFTCMK